jgi:hypothetical protein
MQNPTKPWLEKNAWQKPEIHCNTAASQRGAIFFTIFWNLIAFTVFGVFFNENGFEDPAIFGVSIFPLIGIGLLFNTASKISDLAKYGAASLIMDPFPASIGGNFGGTVQFKKTLPDDCTVEMKLTCIKVRYTGSGKNRSRQEQLIWQSTGFAFIDESNRKNAQFKIDIPSDLEESSLSIEGFQWTVVSTVSYDDHHFIRQFNIPVYKTAERSSVAVDSKSHPDAKKHASELINDVTEFTKNGNEYTLNFPNFRILRLSVVLGILLGGGVLSFTIYSIFNEFLPLMLTIIFGLIGTIFFGLAIFEGFYTLRVHLKPEEIIAEHKWLGIPFKTNHIAKTVLKSFSIGDYVQSNTNNGKHTAYYKISALQTHGKPGAVAIRLKNMATAEQMKHFFELYYKLEEGE